MDPRALDLFGAYMSSPWSTEAFSEGGPGKAASARRLVFAASYQLPPSPLLQFVSWSVGVACRHVLLARTC
jgi:hypothetical protein